MHYKVCHRKSNISFPFFNVYGSIKVGDKVAVWEQIRARVRSLDCNLLVLGGNFNMILDLKEKSGELSKENKSMVDFRDFVLSLGLWTTIQKMAILPGPIGVRILQISLSVLIASWLGRLIGGIIPLL